MSTLPRTPGDRMTSGNDGSTGSGSFRERVRQTMREVESQIILEALEKHRWNRRRAAESLQISYRLLMYKMKSCNLRDMSQGPGTRQEQVR
jgi:two-component system, NtrC family, response regulator AtoC